MDQEKSKLGSITYNQHGPREKKARDYYIKPALTKRKDTKEITAYNRTKGIVI